MTIEDRVLRDLHRAAIAHGRRGIAVPSIDLDASATEVGGRAVAQQALKRLVQAQRVLRVRRDLLVLPDSTGLIGVELADLVHAVAPRPYVVTAGAALQHAGLTDQHYFAWAVLVPRETSEVVYRGQTANFYATDQTNIWASVDAARAGTSNTTSGFATPERAIIDALNHPRYGMSLVQVADALQLAVKRDRRFLSRLQTAVQHYSAGARKHSSRSAARRVGLLVEQLFGTRAAAPYRALIGENRTAILLRPGSNTSGSLDRTWRVSVNAHLDLSDES